MRAGWRRAADIRPLRRLTRAHLNGPGCRVHDRRAHSCDAVARNQQELFHRTRLRDRHPPTTSSPIASNGSAKNTRGKHDPQGRSVVSSVRSSTFRQSPTCVGSQTGSRPLRISIHASQAIDLKRLFRDASSIRHRADIAVSQWLTSRASLPIDAVMIRQRVLALAVPAISGPKD